MKLRYIIINLGSGHGLNQTTTVTDNSKIKIEIRIEGGATYQVQPNSWSIEEEHILISCDLVTDGK